CLASAVLFPVVCCHRHRWMVAGHGAIRVCRKRVGAKYLLLWPVHSHDSIRVAVGDAKLCRKVFLNASSSNAGGACHIAISGDADVANLGLVSQLYLHLPPLAPARA